MVFKRLHDKNPKPKIPLIGRENLIQDSGVPGFIGSEVSV
jgi:hypothetical protein